MGRGNAKYIDQKKVKDDAEAMFQILSFFSLRIVLDLKFTTIRGTSIWLPTQTIEVAVSEASEATNVLINKLYQLRISCQPLWCFSYIYIYITIPGFCIQYLPGYYEICLAYNVHSYMWGSIWILSEHLVVDMCCTRSGDLYNLFSFEDQPSEALEKNLLDSESTARHYILSLGPDKKVRKCMS